MKKMIMSIVYILLAVALTACSESTHTESGGEREQAMGQSKPIVKGVKDVDVVNTHGSIEGIEYMEDFYEKVESGDSDQIRIVHYTIEGDPIVTDLTYEGSSLEVKYDSTRDKFGNGDITTTRCGGLAKEVNPGNTSYVAVDCDNDGFGMDEVLSIQYNVALQDRFEFRLNYGKDLENEVATEADMKNEKGEHASNNDGKTVLIENVAVKQEVYKKLVFANYLREKSFKKSCGSEDAIQYHLLVQINGGEREYRWSDCDKSNNGRQFTDIANGIIERAKKPVTERPDPIVQGYVLEVKEDSLLIGEDMSLFDYEVLKDEIKKSGIDAFNLEFILLEGVEGKKFAEGNKIRATLNGEKIDRKPSRAKVKEMERIESFQ